MILQPIVDCFQSLVLSKVYLFHYIVLDIYQWALGIALCRKNDPEIHLVFGFWSFTVNI